MDVVNLITFEVNMLVFGEKLRFQERAEPGNKVRTSTFEKLYFIVTLFVDVKRQLYFQLVGQGLKKTYLFIQIFLVLVSN